MEQMPMSTPESPGPHDVPFGGLVLLPDDDAFDKLLPKTTIDHLLSEEERQKAEQERKEFEAVGRTLFLSAAEAFPEAEVYPMAYEAACRCIASGVVSADEFREQLAMTHWPLDPVWSIIKEAYEDVLAGRPPRISPTP
jgi:hypothetical protein